MKLTTYIIHGFMKMRDNNKERVHYITGFHDDKIKSFMLLLELNKLRDLCCGKEVDNERLSDEFYEILEKVEQKYTTITYDENDEECGIIEKLNIPLKSNKVYEVNETKLTKEGKEKLKKILTAEKL